MRALSVRQPWAELILRGVKTIEYRSQPTRIVGERFYLYASLKQWPVGAEPKPVGKAWSTDLAMPGDGLPAWLLELARTMSVADLPRGVIVGSAVIEKVTQAQRLYEWHLTDVERFDTPRKPSGHPQPVWFRPF